MKRINYYTNILDAILNLTTIDIDMFYAPVAKLRKEILQKD